MNNLAVKELYSERHSPLPSVNSLLKISLGLILFTMISTALVYAETMSVDVDGTSYDVEYDVTGMTVLGIEADTDFISLILTVDVTESNGTLDITLERSFFDSTFEGLDDDFIILADGDEPNFSEIDTSDQNRTLSIELPVGTEEIEIIGSVFGQSVEETPVEETPVEETPVEETPVEETPVEETPVEETPVEETPVDNTPLTQCGPGTILQDGACVLDERCGPGTVLKDGACVLDSTPQPSSSSIKGMGKDMLMGVIVAFVGAGIVGIVFALISKASKSN
ncbi:hypothetical protein C5F47_06845 [Nitrosopumilus cobalaminigenes]|uniref:Uncharacterized protein n=1 Tax=Nitrosopumilus cobalaminigenes TaxID=1470066 RepID=A0A7D5R767_9ARCH|nr:hypothetical protein [Nitrosopumilus cobalaminigenes]QLH03282.1 hypothetical protein C5F47_06845 [Nitrosopumilus cobalaminigenes]